MNYSFVMGIDESIYTLKNKGFDIRLDGTNFWVTFPKDKSNIWENYISSHLDVGYWNEYLTESCVVFLFRLEEGIRRYEVYDFQNDEVLSLCEKLCECKFDSLKQMLSDNPFYQTILTQ